MTSFTASTQAPQPGAVSASGASGPHQASRSALSPRRAACRPSGEVAAGPRLSLADDLSLATPAGRAASAAARPGPLFEAAEIAAWDRLIRRARFGDGVGRKRDRLAAVKEKATEMLRREIGR